MHLIYLTGGVIESFYNFFIIPSVFASSNLGLRTNLFLVLTTYCYYFSYFLFREFTHAPLNDHFHVSPYYYYSIPIALIIALIFLIILQLYLELSLD